MPGFRELIDWLGDHPEFIAIILVIAGWLIARLVRHAIDRLIPWVNRRASRLGAGRTTLVSPAFHKSLGAVAFWGILFTALTAALSLLGGGGMSGWFDGLLGIIPQVLIALAFLAVGHLLGLLARGVLTKYAAATERHALPSLAYAVIVGTAAITAAEHLGLEVSFLTQVLLIVVGVFLAGLALAFALGARDLVANLAAQGEIQRYKAGDRIKIENIEGTVVEIFRTGVRLATDEGLVSVPASKFATSPVVEVRERNQEDG